jgi:purine-cytosine permease-like protein
MWERLNQDWQRSPAWSASTSAFGSGDMTAAIAVAVLGIPALLIGTDIFGQAGLGPDQLLLMAPLGILAGGFLLGVTGRMAAANGSAGGWLFRPAFGSLPASVMALVRLALTLAWGALVLRIASDWVLNGAEALEWSIPDYLPLAVLGGLALLLTITGPVWTVQRVVRPILFWATVVVVLVATWRILALPGTGRTGRSDADFLLGLDLMFALALLWTPFATDLGRFAQRDEEAGTSLGYGFVIASMLAVVGGAVIGMNLGGFPSDLSLFAPAWAGGVLAIVWVLALEGDEGFSFTTSSTMSLLAAIPWIPGVVMAVIAGGATIAGAMFLDIAYLRSVADLALIGYTASMGVVLADYYVVRSRDYQADALYRWRGYSWFNLWGVVAWVGTVVLASWLRPLGPDPLRRLAVKIPAGEVRDFPVVMFSLIVAFVAYTVLGMFVGRVQDRQYQMRGIR